MKNGVTIETSYKTNDDGSQTITDFIREKDGTVTVLQTMTHNPPAVVFA